MICKYSSWRYIVQCILTFIMCKIYDIKLLGDGGKILGGCWAKLLGGWRSNIRGILGKNQNYLGDGGQILGMYPPIRPGICSPEY